MFNSTLARGLASLLVLSCFASSQNVLGACDVPDDAFFVSAEGGCKDLATGLVWSEEIPYYTNGSNITSAYSATV